MLKGLKILAGDSASFNPVRTFLPEGVMRAELKGLELLPEVMDELGPLMADPDRLVMSVEGAREVVFDLAQNHLDSNQEQPSKKEWKIVRGELTAIQKAAESLHRALGTTCGLTALALLRTGSQMNTVDFLHRLDRIKQDTARALELVPENNMGDAVTSLSRIGTANEMLVLGCQNLLSACGHKAVGASTEGHLVRFSKLVKRLALGGDCSVEGLSAGAMRSEKLKGRSRSRDLRIQALYLVLGDAEQRRGPDSELVHKVWDELVKREE